MKEPKRNELKGSVVLSERQLLRDMRVVCLIDDVDMIGAREFIEDMTLLTNSKKPITVVIASSGGEVEAGLGCIHAIKNAQQRKIKVIGKVYGHAQSMAFIVLQFCNERLMGTGDILMAHGITAFRHGDLKNLEAEGKLFKSWQLYFADVIARRCKKAYADVEYWKKVLADQTPQYFTSQECIEMGLIDIVEEW